LGQYLQYIALLGKLWLVSSWNHINTQCSRLQAGNNQVLLQLLWIMPFCVSCLRNCKLTGSKL
jgi:hypothetical protein